ncbi:MAG: PilZ domain-containing protein [Thermodesulfobacteriota bacterium]|nr:PilZ domain-containing protein [Thermodesulfobacteriota bacterium]
MTTMERRQHERTSIKTDALAMLFPTESQNNPILSNVVDVSMGGLGISYVGWQPRLNETICNIDIIDAHDHIDNLTGMVVYDRPVDADNQSFRRCGVQFQSLSDLQLSQLRQTMAVS